MMRIFLFLLSLFPLLGASAPNWSAIYAKLKPSIAPMERYDEKFARYNTYCSAVVIGKTHVLTEDHCLLKGITVERHRFEKVGQAGTIVLLKTEGRASRWREITVRRSSAGAGLPVATLGYGLGGEAVTISVGVVSASMTYMSAIPEVDGRILLDVNAIGGQSGGPIVDAQGRLISIVSAVVSDQEGSPNGLGHSVRQGQVLALVDSLRK
jgi:hypothetical protein